jgi:multidrug efflux pump subunit AcrA (membrane-fusion protein)
MTDPYTEAGSDDASEPVVPWAMTEFEYSGSDWAGAPPTPVELLRGGNRAAYETYDEQGAALDAPGSVRDRVGDLVVTRDAEPQLDQGGITSPPGVPPSPSDRPKPRRSTRLLYLGIAILAIAAGTTGAGYLEPTAAAYLDFAQNGVVADVLVKPGDHVRAGEVLAEQDSTTLQADLAADQSTLYADRARVLELGAGGATTQQQINALVAQANQTLSTAQAKAAGSLSTAQSHVQVAKERLTQAQSTLADDQAQYSASVTECNAPGRTIASQPTDAQCVQIEAALTNDTNAVNNANASLSQAQLALQTEQNSTAQDLALANSEASLANARQQQAGPTAAAGNSTSIAAADASVSKDLSNVATDQSNIDASEITSPVTGIVGSIGAQPGDYATTLGVHSFTQSGVATAANGFQLFAPPAQSTATSGGTGLNPVAIVYSTTMQVTAQVSEDTVTKLHDGQAASITVPALKDRKIAGVITDINPTSVNNDGKVSYLVDLSITQTGLTGSMPGMTANVTFTK